MQEKVIAGDHVVFRIANNINAAQQAQQLGAVVSRLVGEYLGLIKGTRLIQTV